MEPALHSKYVQDQAEKVLDAKGVTYSYARVFSVYPDGSVNLQRQANRMPDGSWPADGVPTPVMDPTVRLAVGDNVLVSHHGGHARVEGRKRRAGDRDTKDLSDNKLERNGSQPMQTGSNTFQIRKEGQFDLLVLRDTAGQEGRFNTIGFEGWTGQRGWIGIDSSNRVALNNSSGGSIRSNQVHQAPNFRTDLGYTLNGTRDVADTAKARADDAWTRANNAQATADTKTPQHWHDYTRTTWTNYLHTDGRTYMTEGFWETIRTSLGIW